MLNGLFGRKPEKARADALYRHVVAAARSPHLYAELGVPDTVEGRFEMVALHVWLVMRRLRGDEAASAPIMARTPMKRWGDPAEVANATVFLASPAARHITGETLLVDAGTHLGYAPLAMR